MAAEVVVGAGGRGVEEGLLAVGFAVGGPGGEGAGGLGEEDGEFGDGAVGAAEVEEAAGVHPGTAAVGPGGGLQAGERCGGGGGEGGERAMPGGALQPAGLPHPVPEDYCITNTSERVASLILGTAKLSNGWDGIRKNDLTQ